MADVFDVRAKNNKILPRLDSNSDRMDRRQRSLPLSHRVTFLYFGSVFMNANRIHLFLVSLFELMLNAPVNSYVHTETLPHGTFIQN